MPFFLPFHYIRLFCASTSGCARKSGPGRERQSPAAADGAGRQRAGAEGLRQAFSDASGEQEVFGTQCIFSLLTILQEINVGFYSFLITDFSVCW